MVFYLLIILGLGVAIFGRFYSPEIKHHPFFLLLLGSLLSFVSNAIIPYGNYSIIQFEFLSIIFLLLFIEGNVHKGRLKNTVGFINILVLILYILVYASQGVFLSFIKLTNLSNIVHLVTCICLLFEIMDKGEDERIQNNPNFWFITSWLLFVSTYFIRDLSLSTWNNYVPSTFHTISMIVANVLFYSFLLIGFVKCKNRQQT